MKMTSEAKEKALREVTGFLSAGHAYTRSEVIDGVLSRYDFSEKEKREKSNPNAKVNLARSYIGTTLTNLVTSGDVVVGKDKKYSMKKEKVVVVESAQCRTVVFSLLARKPMTKSELFSALEKHFGTDKTASAKDDHAVRGLAGQILGAAVAKKQLLLENNTYSLPVEKVKKIYPKEPLDETAFRPVFLDRLCDMGGAFFERFVANMLEKYYLITGRDVLLCDVVGGSDDGGVDVIVDTMEELGFVEHIMVQAKCRRNIQVTEKEVREFYGALNALGGTRGIFVTTSTFHPCAEKLLLSIDNCVGLDGNKVFNIVKQTAYGIHKTKNGYTFDNTIFSE